MDTKLVKSICFSFLLVALVLIVVYAINVFLLAFAALLLGSLLHALGKGGQTLTRLPYPLALILSLAVVLGGLVWIFWLYSPLIAEQFQLLINQFPQAANTVQERLTPYFGDGFFSSDRFQKELALLNEKLLSHVVSLFSLTVSSVVSFLIFLIIGFYLALSPHRYLNGILFLFPPKKHRHFWITFEHIGRSLRWWLLAKLLSMFSIGLLTYVGLRIMGIPLAFILGLVMALLTFIPYVGPILASIPAIFIAFAASPLLAVYVAILYLALHAAEGYLITPFIEQKTVAVPPALTIIMQMLMVMLVGGLGLALATPLTVVLIALGQKRALNLFHN